MTKEKRQQMFRELSLCAKDQETLDRLRAWKNKYCREFVIQEGLTDDQLRVHTRQRCLDYAQEKIAHDMAKELMGCGAMGIEVNPIPNGIAVRRSIMILWDGEDDRKTIL